MNYRHAFHAGNCADVLKHVVLVRLIEYLKHKHKAFRVIDTHAGAGLYDLSSAAAQRTVDWRDGIGRLIGAQLPADATALLQPYLDAIAAHNPSGTLQAYPGSPLIARQLLRRQDRLSLVELHPEEAGQLRRQFAGDIQARVIELDGWLALGAHLPPKERRGLVLVDPPFEEAGEFERLSAALAKAHRRWPGGVYALWYPIKDRRAVDAFRQTLAATGIPKILDVWLTMRGPSATPRLDGSGVIVVNPNYELEKELKVLLPVLTRLLAQNRGASFGADWLAGEQGAT